MKTCSNCHAQSYRDESKFCQKCGAALPEHQDVTLRNTCTNPNCEYNKTQFIYPDDSRFCDICGSKTGFAMR
ncbi:MAG: zinc-ribbon domain-containing protein [Oscillospiraceae bacterium]|nr:zinc-ribbon domain-containing protein [Oscillospiraceae bacterium]